MIVTAYAYAFVYAYLVIMSDYCQFPILLKCFLKF